MLDKTQMQVIQDLVVWIHQVQDPNISCSKMQKANGSKPDR